MALSKIDESSWGGTQLGGRKNVVINGAMKISQRETSFVKTSYTGGAFYCLDRYYFQGSHPSIDMTVDQSSDAPAATGLRNSLKVTINSGNSSYPAATNQYFRIRHAVEAQDCTHLVEQPCTLTFWVKSSVTGQYDVALFAPDSSSNHQVVPYTIDAANTWEKKTLRFTGPAQINDDNENGLDIQWQLSRAGSAYQTSSTNVWGSTKLSSSTSSDAFIKTTGATFFLTGVQVEKGDPTEFEHRSYGEELLLCSRYYHEIKQFVFNANKGNDTYWDGHARAGAYAFPVPMRASPTVSIVQTYGWLANTSGWTTPSSGRHPVSTGATNEQSVAFTGSNYWDDPGTGGSAGNTTAVRIEKATVNAEL